MTKKKKIIIIILAFILAAFAFIYKMPKGIDDILIHPFYFDERGNYSCFGGIPEELRMHFPPDEESPGYEEISGILKEMEFVADFRNIVPVKYTFPKLAKSGSQVYIDDFYSSIVIEFRNGRNLSCDIAIYDDGTVAVQSFEYHDVIYSYRLKNKELYEKLWDYIYEKGSGVKKEYGENSWEPIK